VPKPKIIKNSLFEKVDTSPSKTKNIKKVSVKETNSFDDDNDDQESSNWDSDKSSDKPTPKVKIVTNNLFNTDNQSKKSNYDSETVWIIKNLNIFN